MHIAIPRHLRDLMSDEKRCMSLIKESEGIYCDFSRQRVTGETVKVREGDQGKGKASAMHGCAATIYDCSWAFAQLLTNLAEAADLKGKIDAMFSGEHINSTEDRAVLHVATRSRRDQVCGLMQQPPCMHAAGPMRVMFCCTPA